MRVTHLLQLLLNMLDARGDGVIQWVNLRVLTDDGVSRRAYLNDDNELIEFEVHPDPDDPIDSDEN